MPDGAKGTELPVRHLMTKRTHVVYHPCPVAATARLFQAAPLDNLVRFIKLNAHIHKLFLVLLILIL